MKRISRIKIVFFNVTARRTRILWDWEIALCLAAFPKKTQHER
jgi:hypothetical protein